MRSHLLLLKDEAVGLGASDAKIIPADMIRVEDEIIEMCKAPRCEGYGKSANCPPHVMGPERAREWIREYPAAILFKIDVPAALLVSPDRFEAFRRVYEISSALEAISVEAGYVFSKALGAGSCKPVFCPETPCQILEGTGGCRAPELARPSMEALGINVFRLVRDAGWEIQPILRTTDPETVSQGMLAGLLLVS